MIQLLLTMRLASLLLIATQMIPQNALISSYLLPIRSIYHNNLQSKSFISPYFRPSKRQQPESPFLLGRLFANASAASSGGFELSGNSGEMESSGRSITLDPETFREAEVLGLRLMQDGKYEAALKVFENGMKLPGSKSDIIRSQTLAVSPVGGSAGGREGKAVLLLDEFERQAAYYNIACAQCEMGNISLAVFNLRKSFDNGFDNYATVKVDPNLRNLVDVPEFNALMEEYDSKGIFKNPFNLFGKK